MRAATKADVSAQAGLALYRTIVKEYSSRYGIGVEDALGYLRRNGISTHAAAEDVGRILAAHMAGLDEAVLDAVSATGELSFASGYTQVLSIGEQAFDLVDRDAVDWLTQHTTYWIGDKSGPRLHEDIATLVRTRIVEEGLSSGEAGEELAALFGHHYNRDELYWRGLAGNTAATGRNFGSVGAFEDVGAERYSIITAEDERVCPICGEMDLMEFPVSAAVSMRNAMLATTDPTAIKDVHPWQRVSDDRSSPEAVLAAGGHMPPFHFLCRCLVGLA
jgi:hypothetical protein